jgi:hypothetical protein
MGGSAVSNQNGIYDGYAGLSLEFNDSNVRRKLDAWRIFGLRQS